MPAYLPKPDYPLRFAPIYKETLWGGQVLAQGLGRSLPAGRRIGESWEISDRPGDCSVVAQGPWAGRKMRSLIEAYPTAILGPRSRGAQRFPLLIKFIGSTRKLSLQVHPSRAHARERHGEGSGKNEMWYILAAGPQAHIFSGFKRKQTPAGVRRAVAEERLELLLNRAPAAPGDAFMIRAGKIHGLGQGILMAEIQENSNRTYRVYDYGRRDTRGRKRELHLEEALRVLDVRDRSAGRIRSRMRSPRPGQFSRLLAANRWFHCEEITVATDWSGPVHRKFQILLGLAGKGWLYHRHGKEPLARGAVWLLPAGLQSWRIKPMSQAVKILRVWT